MHPAPIQKLIEYFMRFPGIGPRQASRFAYTLLDEDEKTINGLQGALKELQEFTARCEECFRSIEKKEGRRLCHLCKGDISEILIVEKDQDLEAVTKTGAWQGSYHVLGGTISLLNEKSRVTERIAALYERLKKRVSPHKKIEIVLATSATTEGDSTALYIERVLEPFVKSGQLSVSRLARGISSGTEIEYADYQTITHALHNRK